jgi:hypothetical protein
VYIGIVALLIGVLLLGFVRSFRCGIRLDDIGVEVRTTYATRRWRWESIERARVLDRPVRGSPYLAGIERISHREDRYYVLVVLTFTDGSDLRLYGLRFVASEPSDSAWVDGAVREINQTLSARRGESGASRPTPR